MPDLRGLLASLGAGVSLAAAGTVALLAVSVVILFQGFPGLGLEAQGGTLELTVPRSETAEPEDEGPVLLADVPVEDASEDTVELGGAVAPDEPAAADPLVTSPRRSPTGPDTSAPPAPTPAPPPPPPGNGAPAPLPDTDEPVSGITGLTGDVLRTTGETLAPVTDTLLPGSGKAVEGLSDDLGDTVQSTGGALGATLGLLLAGR